MNDIINMKLSIKIITLGYQPNPTTIQLCYITAWRSKYH